MPRCNANLSCPQLGRTCCKQGNSPCSSWRHAGRQPQSPEDSKRLWQHCPVLCSGEPKTQALTPRCLCSHTRAYCCSLCQSHCSEDGAQGKKRAKNTRVSPTVVFLPAQTTSKALCAKQSRRPQTGTTRTSPLGAGSKEEARLSATCHRQTT